MSGYKLLARLGAIIAGPLLLIAAIASLYQHDPTIFLAAITGMVVIGFSLAYLHLAAWWLMK